MTSCVPIHRFGEGDIQRHGQGHGFDRIVVVMVPLESGAYYYWPVVLSYVILVLVS
jgi:hypothetical protein